MEERYNGTVPVMCARVPLSAWYGTIVSHWNSAKNYRHRCPSPTSFCWCADTARSDYAAVDTWRPRVFGGGSARLERSPSCSQKFDVDNHLPPRTKDDPISFIVWSICPHQMKNYNIYTVYCSPSTLLQRTLSFSCVQCPCNALAFSVTLISTFLIIINSVTGGTMKLKHSKKTFDMPILQFRLTFLICFIWL